MVDYRRRIYDQYASAFQGTAATFDPRAADNWGRAFQHYLRDWLPGNPQAAVMDLACGDGKLLRFFQRHGYQRISGVDISPEQVELARQVVPDVELNTVFDSLKAHEQSFDLITGLDIIEHLHKDEVFEFLDGCYRALRPGGRLILQTPNAESPWAAAVRYGDFTHEVSFNPNLLKRLLGMCGFKQVEAREQGPVPRGYSLKSTARFAVWQAIRCGLKIWNSAETGHGGSGVFTRVFLVSGIK